MTKNLPAEIDASGPPPLPCRKCQRPTPRVILSNFGAMCEPCYRAWQRQPLPPTPDVGDKAKDGPRAWIAALQRRIDSGERLTQFQRQCLDEAQGRGRFAPKTEETEA